MGRDGGAAVLIGLALFLLLLPLRWVAALVIAMTVHELSHYLAVRLCGGKIRRIHAGLNGMRMEVEALPPWQELLCALAGPAGGFLLLLFVRLLPRTAICAAFQSLFNLLPVYPLDGGRAMRCCGELLLPGRAEGVCKAVEILCLAAILYLGCYGTFVLKLGLLPLGMAAILLQRSIAVKIPCKAGIFSVQ